MDMLKFSRVVAVAVVLVASGGGVLVSSAQAHISLEQGGTHMSRYGDGAIKDAPCGRAGGARGTNVYTYAPGETITVTIVEFVPHPGYFRIAFDDDGDDDFEDPATIDPISRSCQADATDQCGAADFFNNEAVLLDNLEPHLSSGTQTYSFEVTLPNVQCTNCTLQVIQVMEDTVHGPYNPSSSGVSELFYIEDIYHTCIDLVLEGELAAEGTGDPGAVPTTPSTPTTPTSPTTPTAPTTPVDSSGMDMGAAGSGAPGTPVTGTPVPGAVPTPSTGDPASQSPAAIPGAVPAAPFQPMPTHSGSDSGGCAVGGNPGRDLGAGSMPWLLAALVFGLRRRRYASTRRPW